MNEIGNCLTKLIADKAVLLLRSLYEIIIISAAKRIRRITSLRTVVSKLMSPRFLYMFPDIRLVRPHSFINSHNRTTDSHAIALMVLFLK